MVKRFKKDRGTFWDGDKRLNMTESVNIMNSLHEENMNIKKAIENYIKDYEISDDYNRHDPRIENHTIKHLSYCDMQKHVCSTVLGVLGHLKEYYSCPECGSSDEYFIEVHYARFWSPPENNVYEKRECAACGYNETVKRPEYVYKEEEWRRQEFDYENL